MRFVVDLKKVNHDRNELGEYGFELTTLFSLDIRIPKGFIITTDAYFDFLDINNLRTKVNHLLENYSEKTAEHIRKNILESDLPEDLIKQIFNHYQSLGWQEKYVSLLPSVSDKDIHLKSTPNIKGEAVLLTEIKNIWASFFEEEILLFRHLRNLSHFKTGIAIVVLEDLPIQKEGFIEESKITLKKGTKITDEEEKQLLDIEHKVLEHHYFSKRVSFVISQGKVYATRLDPIAGKIQPAMVKSADEIVEVRIDTDSFGRIATGVVGKEILVEDSLDYKKLKEIRHAKGLVLKKEIDNPHIRIVLSQMGFPVVVSKENFKTGSVVTVDGSKNRVYNGPLNV